MSGGALEVDVYTVCVRSSERTALLLGPGLRSAREAGAVSGIDPEVVSRIAALAALDLAPNDRERVAAELGAIVSWVDELAELPPDSEDVSAGPRLSLRTDRVTNATRPADLLSVAPDLDGERFRVPAVLER